MGVIKQKRPESGQAISLSQTPGFTGDGSGLTGIPSTAVVGNTAFGHSLMRVAHMQYSFAVDGGAIGAITPANTALMPANAIIYGAIINPTTAVQSLGSATVAVGTTAGSSATSLLTATAKATLSANALVNGAATFAAAVKLSAAGSLNITVGTAALTAGIIEVYVFYVVSST